MGGGTPPSPCCTSFSVVSGGVKFLPDPLSVAQIEQKQIIAMLEKSYQVRGVKAEVRVYRLRRLRHLNAQLEQAQAGCSRATALAISRRVEAELAIEIVRWWTETSMWLWAASWMRRMAYRIRERYATARRRNPLASLGGWSLAG